MEADPSGSTHAEAALDTALAEEASTSTCAAAPYHPLGTLAVATSPAIATATQSRDTVVIPDTSLPMYRHKRPVPARFQRNFSAGSGLLRPVSLP